ncbi:lipid-A-disaccharide synthase N-terminal domain-containing protein [Methylopila musalis]|uniref:Lipid-A-disaccharide synthase N-terminal domain-containing protein n=1 Tax=Methylopila musalis TaxID=1134781 RepID=A0ABW3Z5Y1_9HYPH
MPADLAHAVGGYLHDVFVAQLDAWIMLGWIAQALFTARFLVQWAASEKAGRSVVPAAFWLFSLGGGALLLIYAIGRKDPVFIVGQAMGLFIYARNLQFIVRRARRKASLTARRRQSAAPSASRASASPVVR